MKDCAFYFDNPSIDQEITMRRNLQKKYADDLFADVMKPRLQSRKDLVMWACESQNQFMDEVSAPAKMKLNCMQYQGLLNQYGPDYSSLKEKVGYIRGLFEDNDWIEC